MKQTLTDIQVEYDEPIPIYCDNTLSMMSPILIYRLSMMIHQYLKEPSDALQDEAHSNKVSLSTGTGCREEHQS
jgi:hypothetical protein